MPSPLPLSDVQAKTSPPLCGECVLFFRSYYFGRGLWRPTTILRMQPTPHLPSRIRNAPFCDQGLTERRHDSVFYRSCTSLYGRLKLYYSLFSICHVTGPNTGFSPLPLVFDLPSATKFRKQDRDKVFSNSIVCSAARSKHGIPDKRQHPMAERLHTLASHLRSCHPR